METSLQVLALFIVISLLNTAAAALDLSKPHETWRATGAAPLKVMANLPKSKQSSNRHTAEVGGFISYQVNVSSAGANVLNDAGNEPSIAVNPLNPEQIVIGWRQFNNTNSDFRQAGLAYSHDGGMTWNNIGPLEPGIFRSDPVLAAAADGTFFYQSLAVESQGQPGLDDDIFRVDQWRSVDGGVTWIDKINAIGGDKSWYAIDQTATANQGNVYAAWNLAGNNHYPNSFNYSLDNGMSYSSPEQLPKSPIFGTVAIGFDGEVYVVGINGETNLNDFHLIKTNNPMSAIFPDFNQSTPLNLGGSVAIGGINPVGLLGQVWVATDKSNRHTRGSVYVAASVDRFGGDPLDLNFIRSRDGGNTFTSPKKINDDNSFIDWQWFGTMGVAPNGRIDLLWLDTRSTGANIQSKTHSELFYSYSYDGGLTFSKNQAISPSFNHYLGYPVQQKMGDYIDIVSDNAGAHVAYTATYTGGQDVYYIHAKPAGVIENPYFPSHEMDGAWISADVPRQGVVSKTLVLNANSNDPQIINFEAVFTEDMAGNPTWMVLQNKHPIEGDSMTFVIMYPTGDLSDGGTALRPIGLATKSRLYDDEGELVKNKLLYQFNMKEEVMDEVMNLTEPAQAFDADFYTGSPFFQVEKQITLEPVIAPEQARNVHCKVQNLALQNNQEKSEGRMPVAFRTGAQAQLFVADFTYQKTVDDNGNQVLLTGTDGLAKPTWQVMNTASGDLLSDTPLSNEIFIPNGGNGFFNATTQDPGVTLVGTESFTQSGEFEITSENSNGSVEKLNAIAFNGYCGDNTQ